MNDCETLTWLWAFAAFISGMMVMALWHMLAPILADILRRR